MATIINQDVFQDLHKKYEKLKTVCKECFLRHANFLNENNGKTESDGQRHNIDMPELDANFEIVLNSLNEYLNKINETHKYYSRLVAMKASIYYEQAKTLVNNNKELEAKALLEIAIELLKEYSQNPELSFLYLRITNHYAYLLSKGNELEKARLLLESSDIIYKNLLKTSKVKIFNSDDLFVAEESFNLREDTMMKLEKLVTNNLQMLGWVYSREGRNDKFATTHHNVLRRRLEMRDGDALVWALKTARLASYFLSENKFRQARYYLSAASLILEDYETDLNNHEMNDSVATKWKELQHYYADIAKCWVKYGIYLFSISKTRILELYYSENNQRLEETRIFPFNDTSNHKKGEELEAMKKSLKKNSVKETDTNPEGDSKAKASDKEIQDPANKLETGATGDTKPEMGESSQNSSKMEIEDSEALLYFPTLKVLNFEREVTANLIETVEEARALFKFTFMWIKRSKIFYTIQEHPLEYISAILDLSELYRFLAFYENDVELQYDIQKRRADSLETLRTLLREVRPEYYIAVSVELIRELAEVQVEMLGLNLRCLSKNQENANREETLHKMEAVADIHAQLEQLNVQMTQTPLCVDELEEMEEDEVDDSDSENEIDETSVAEAAV